MSDATADASLLDNPAAGRPAEDGHPAEAHHDILGHEHDMYDYSSSKMAMWLFLFTELLIFGGMFLSYAYMRYVYPKDFHHAAEELNVLMGLINTFVLLTSSLTVAMAITAAQKGMRQLSVRLIWLTILLAGVFLVIKYFEWSTKIGHGIYPGSPVLKELSHGEAVFFGLYFTMTGLHALHVVIGAVLLAVSAVLLKSRPYRAKEFSPDVIQRLPGGKLALQDKLGQEIWATDSFDGDIDHVRLHVAYAPKEQLMTGREWGLLENFGLYWHLVDIIWIFLFPLFYLLT